MHLVGSGKRSEGSSQEGLAGLVDEKHAGPVTRWPDNAKIGEFQSGSRRSRCPSPQAEWSGRQAFVENEP